MAKVAQCFTKSLFLKYQLLILLVQVTRPLQDRPMRYQKAINRRDSRIFYGLWYGKRATRETGWIDPMKVTMLMKHIQVKKIK